MMGEFRLDYTWDGGKRGYKDIDDRYYEIRYISPDIEGRVHQPVGPDMTNRDGIKGTNTDPPPCTQNGLLGGKTVIPEFKVNGAPISIDYAEIYEIDNEGMERIIGYFKESENRFVPVIYE